MAYRHPDGTTAHPPPPTRRRLGQRPRWTARERSPPRTAADPHAAPPAAVPATASLADPPNPTVAVAVPASQPLTIEVLRRPVEPTLHAPVAVMHQAVQVCVGAALPDGHLQGIQGQVGAQVGGQLPAVQPARLA